MRGKGLMSAIERPPARERVPVFPFQSGFCFAARRGPLVASIPSCGAGR
jgi:hypothetical protein